jgi:hypothetical protein
LEKGLQQGIQGSIICIIEVRFEHIPHKLRELIRKIEDLDILDTFLVQAVTTQSLEAFESVANQYVTEEALELENAEPSCGEGGNET